MKRRGTDAGTLLYRGADRRGRNVDVQVQLPSGRLLLMSALVACGAGVPALFLLLRRADLTTLDSYLAIAAGLLCVVAGATWLVAWRILGRSLPGWLGCACITLGVLTLISNGVSYLGVGPLPAALPLDDLVRVVIVGWLVWRGVTDHEVNAALHPMVSLLVPIGAGTVAMGVLNVAGAHGLLGWVTTAPAEACNAASAAIWFAVALAGLRRWTDEDRVPSWIVGAVVLFMVGCVARCLGHGTQLATVVAFGFLLLGAALVDGTAITRLQGVLAGGDRLQLQLQSALAASRREAVSEQQQLEDWLHDLQNAVAGLQAADAVLRAGTPSVAAEHAQLADAVTAELTRLHALVDRSRRLHVVDLDLEEILGPIVMGERALGAVVEARLGGISVQADRSALCRIVQNVLLNARRYAPGTPVVISAEQLGDVVELSLRDHGPGVPSHERCTIFERGSRGASSRGAPGTGLGLYVARTLALAMGGDMYVRADGLPGCCIVLTLPSLTESRTGLGRVLLEPAV